MSYTNKAWAAIVALVLVSYVGLMASLAPLLLGDYPNHLARAVVMTDLLFHHGAAFGTQFSYRFLFAPYVMGDWILASLIEVVGVAAAANAFAVFVFLSLPGALLVYLRARRTPMDATLLALLVSVYLSTDAFFALGFMSFRLGVATLLLTLAAAEGVRRDGSAARVCVFISALLLAYLTHFSAIIFIAAALGTSTIIRLYSRTSRVGREFLLLAPLGCVMVWHFVGEAGFRQSQDLVAEGFFWGTPASKVMNLFWNFVRYRVHWDALLLTLLAACLFFWTRARCTTVNTLRQSAMLELWATAAAFFGIYILLPWSYAEASIVDVRALTLAWLFVVVGAASLPERAAPRARFAAQAAMVCALALTALNLGFLAKQFRSDALWLHQYRSIVAHVPEGSHVLPVYTGQKSGNVRPTLHAASFAVIDRAAQIPYLFSGDTGAPMKYFRYIDRPYAPDEAWYTSRRNNAVDWTSAAAHYQYLLLMKPIETSRVPIAGSILAEDDAVALVAVR
jgi:hypothetical protein